MFFSASKLVVYIKRQELHFYLPNNKKYIKIDLPQDALFDLEVINRDKLIAYIKGAISNFGLKAQDSVIVLSDEVYFQKALDLETDTRQAEIQQFLDEVPFDPSKIAKKIMVGTSGELVIATNSQLYLAIKDALEGSNFKIEAILPITVFGIANLGPILVDDDLKHIKRNVDRVKEDDFLNEEEPVTPAVKEESPLAEIEGEDGSSKKIVLASLGIFLILVALVLAGFAFGIIKNPLSKAKEEAAPVQNSAPVEPSSAPESTEEAEVSARSDLRIQVLNGSSTPGQATRVSERLTAIGYADIQVGNATSEPGDQTQLTFYGNISSFLKNEITEEIKAIFVDVAVEETSKPVTLNVIITTGKEK